MFSFGLNNVGDFSTSMMAYDMAKANSRNTLGQIANSGFFGSGRNNKTSFYSVPNYNVPSTNNLTKSLGFDSNLIYNVSCYL